MGLLVSTRARVACSFSLFPFPPGEGVPRRGHRRRIGPRETHRTCRL